MIGSTHTGVPEKGRFNINNLSDYHDVGRETERRRREIIVATCKRGVSRAQLVVYDAEKI